MEIFVISIFVISFYLLFVFSLAVPRSRFICNLCWFIRYLFVYKLSKKDAVIIIDSFHKRLWLFQSLWPQVYNAGCAIEFVKLLSIYNAIDIYNLRSPSSPSDLFANLACFLTNLNEQFMAVIGPIASNNTNCKDGQIIKVTSYLVSA